jgi:filamentous hemagglutinin family protein
MKKTAATPRTNAAIRSAILTALEASRQRSARMNPSPDPGATGGRSGRRVGAQISASTCASLSILFWVPTVFADPSGGQVTSGTGSINHNANSTVINQQTQNLAINWNSFSIAADESVRFNQPNSTAIVLNRVLGQSPSEILGNLSANGQVYILNPNGVLFGKGAEVNVGALVASTLSLSDADLQAGHYQFSADNPSGKVVNQGSLTAAGGGYLALLGPNVSNSGSMKVMGGTVLLAAGNMISLQLNNGSLLSYSIDKGALDALAENDQLIQANGGRVFLSAQGADSVSRAVVNNTGIIEAQTVDNHGGVIRLLGDSAVGQVNVSGTLDASAPNGGDGGVIETSAATVKVADSARISTVAAAGKTGTWLVDPTDFTIAASGGDITGTTLSNELQSTNITLSSTSGAVSGNGDLFVNDAVSWSTNNSLTLTAVRDIQVNRPISASGSGSAAGLTLSAGRNIQVGSTISLSGDTTALSMTYGSGDNYHLNTGAAINLPGSHVSLTIGDGSSSGTHSYTVINSVGVDADKTTTTLQGIKNNLSGYYALGTDIDASSTSNKQLWPTLGGFQPIGTLFTTFTGQFHGLDHSISNLTIAPGGTYAALFGGTGTNSIIRDVGIEGITAVGGTGSTYSYAGGLAGANYGTISNSYVISSSSMTTTISGDITAGGLVGWNLGSITNSHSAGTVSGTSNNLGSGHPGSIGGLVGYNEGGVISLSYASGTVSSSTNDYVGGLVGLNAATTSATTGDITTSYFSDGTVSGLLETGGLVGRNAGFVSNSYANATVAGSGGAIGGFIGSNWGDVDHSYSTSLVSGTGSYGFIGETVGTQGAVTSSYWVMSGATTDLSTATGLTSTQAQLASSYSGWDFTSTWRIYDGHTTPLLKAFLTPLVITAASLSTTYNGSAYSGGLSNPVYSIAGADTSGHLNGIATAYNGDRNAGTYAPDLWSDQHGYDISFINSALTINKATLTVTGVFAANKVYDATTGATLAGTATVTPFGSDNVTVSGSGTGVFSEKNVGTDKAVTVTGYTLSGAAAGNYTLIEPTGLTANITPASLAISGLIANNKVYDATTSATASGTAGVVALGTDSVSLSGTGSASFADKNVGAGKVVTISGYSLSGADASNYVLVQPTGLTANISPASLVVTGVTASNKVYDATVAATLGGSVSITAFNGDNVALSGTGNGVFSDKNVGANKTVTVSGYALTGADAGNYTLVEPTGLTASITPANLVINGVAANNKVYDATLTATLSVTATVTALGSDNVVLSGSGSGAFVDKNVGNNKAVTVSGYSLSGGDAGNYTLVEPTGLTANITPTSLVLGGISANNKVYDTTVAATLSGTAVVNPLGNDVVSVVGTGAGVFASKNVGLDKAVTVSGYTLSGADANNYTLIEPTGLSANISAANLLISGVTANNKIYDTTTSDTLSGTAGVTALGSDNVSLAGTGVGVFASKNVGTGKAVTVTVTGFTLSGADAGNYNLVEPTGLTASITPASLAITGVVADNKVYDATLTAALGGTATVAALGSDNVVLSGSGSGSFAGKNVGNNKTVTVSGYSLSGADAANYTLLEPTGLTANITPASLSISGIAANNKVYDTTVAATLSGTAIITPLGNDSVTVSGTGVGVFSDKNAGLNKSVTVSAYTLSGVDAGNYTLVEPTGLTADISPANLVVSGLTAATKVYDGTVAATLGGTAFVSALGNDTIILAGSGSGTFVNKNVGTNKTVNVSGFALSGADAANYTLVEPTNVTATITARPLTISATGIDKVYDGSTSAAVTLADNRVAGDALTTGYTSAAFADANVGTGKTISVSGISLSGTDAGNYTFNTSATTTANVTAAPLTITANAATKTYDGLAYSGGNGVSFSGFVAGQTLSVLGGTLSYGGSSQGAINVGSYNIIPGGLTSTNYTIAFVNGTLTITQAAVAAAINAVSALNDATNALSQ